MHQKLNLVPSIKGNYVAHLSSPPSRVPLTNTHQLRTVAQEAVTIPPICILDTATGWFQSMEAEETRDGIDING